MSTRETLWAEYASEIITSIITASLLGVCALFWTYIGHPKIARLIKAKRIEQGRKEIEDSLSQFLIGVGTNSDEGNYIKVKVFNKTNRPIVIRSVNLISKDGGLLGLWHDVESKYNLELTKKVETGIQVAPHDGASWIFPGEIISRSLKIDQLGIDFEYDAGENEIGLCCMKSDIKHATSIREAVDRLENMNREKITDAQPAL